jgi:hypothetical protein
LADFSGLFQLSFAIGIVPPELAQLPSQSTYPSGKPPSVLEAHFVYPEHLGINKSVVISSQRRR